MLRRLFPQTCSVFIFALGATVALIGTCSGATLELVDYWPALDRTLRTQQAVYLRVRYSVEAEASCFATVRFSRTRPF